MPPKIVLALGAANVYRASRWPTTASSVHTRPCPSPFSNHQHFHKASMATSTNGRSETHRHGCRPEQSKQQHTGSPKDPPHHRSPQHKASVRAQHADDVSSYTWYTSSSGTGSRSSATEPDVAVSSHTGTSRVQSLADSTQESTAIPAQPPTGAHALHAHFMLDATRAQVG